LPLSRQRKKTPTIVVFFRILKKRLDVEPAFIYEFLDNLFHVGFGDSLAGSLFDAFSSLTISHFLICANN
jgi:hypothetical protein